MLEKVIHEIIFFYILKESFKKFQKEVPKETSIEENSVPIHQRHYQIFQLFDSVQDITKAKNELIQNQYYPTINEINHELSKFFLVNETLIRNLSTLDWKKIQDVSVALIKIIPNKFVHEIELFYKKDGPFDIVRKEKHKLNIQISEIAMAKFKNFYEKIIKKLSEFKVKCQEILLNFSFLLEKIEKVTISISKMKVFF